ncbi:MAG: S8 family serine peptidase [Ignavibacteriales bacterium]|nr:MAG: S8 family serine peptidase [Ignavibacteriales bacterium]
MLIRLLMRSLILIAICLIFISQSLLFAQTKLVETNEFFRGNQILPQSSSTEMMLSKSSLLSMRPELQKLSSDLVQLINPELLPAATTLEEHCNSFISMNALQLDLSKSSFTEQVNSGSVYAYIFLNSSTLNGLNQYSLSITDRDDKNNIVVAWIKISELEILSGDPQVKMIRTVIPPVLNTGSVTTQGDIIHRTSNVRSIFSYNGTGVNIGVVSDGVTNRSSSQGTGDLPADGSGLTVLNNSPGGNEGTAILEILHDVVPGSNLFFHGIGTNTVSFNNAITNLVNAGCKIIGDDIGWIDQPFFQDGTVASHIKSLINSNDIIYVTSAGNGAQSHYQGDFYPIPSQPTQHFFGQGDSTSGFYMYANVPANQNIRVVLQWNDQFGASSNDYDLYIYRINANNSFALVARSEGIQNGTQDPIEFINWTRGNNPAQSNDYAIIVNKYSGVAKNLEVFLYPSGSAFNYSNSIKPEDAIYGHAALNEVVSVGAVDQANPGVIEVFSSQGPSTITFPLAETRLTPKVVGTDFVSVTGAGGFPTSFGGTSAAMPHIQGVLAQAWSKAVTFNASQIKQVLFDWSFDLGSAGYDNIFGYGLADALEIFNNNPLPVELSSFSVSVKGDKNILTWKTETEINNYGFEVQRNIFHDSKKWGEWTKCGFVAGNGNSYKPVTYRFEDETVKSSTVKYRLKQIDTDGKISFSKEIEIKQQPDNFELSQNYPNPFNPTTMIEYSLPVQSDITISVYNLLGQLVTTLISDNQDPGYYQTTFDGERLSSGVYIYAIVVKPVDGSKAFSQTRKMQLIK